MSAVEILFQVGGIRDVESAISSIGKSLDKLAKTGQSAADRQIKARIAGEKEAARQIERAARDESRNRERISREEVRVRNQINALELREYAKGEREKTRAFEAAARERARIDAKWHRETEQRARTFGRVAGGAVSRTLGAAGRIAAGALALGGGFTIVDALGKGIANEATAGQIARSAQITGGLGSKDIIGAARGAALVGGGTSEDALQGLDEFVRKTGDLQKGVTLLQDLAKYSAASGASMSDLGSTAAELFNQLGNTDETKTALLALMGQGKAGAIDIRDLSQYGARIASSANLFEGGTGANIAAFGTIAQLAKSKGGATDAAEATEAVSALFGEMATHGKEFKSLGVELRGKGGKLRNIEDILTETIEKEKGDPLKLEKLFGRRASKAVLGLSSAYNEAGGDVAAVRAKFAEGREQSMKVEDVEAGVAGRRAETQAKLNEALERFTTTMQDRLMPMLPGLIQKFTDLIPSIQRAIEFFTNGSIWEGAAKLAGLALAAEIGKAGIAELISKMVTGGAAPVIGALTTPAVELSALAGVGGAGAGAGAAGAGGGGGAAALGFFGGIGAAGASLIAAPLALALGAGIWGEKKEKRGEAEVAALLSEGEDTSQGRASKLAHAQQLLAQAKSRKTAEAAFNKGTESGLAKPEREALANATTAGYAKHIQELDSVVQRLTGAMGELADKVPGANGPSVQDRGGVQ